VVTPRTLDAFHGQTLVLPGVSTLDDAERQTLKAFVDQGGRLVVLGDDATGLPQSDKKIVLPNDPGGAYFKAVEGDFAVGSAHPPQELLNALKGNGDIKLNAPTTVAANFAVVNGSPHVYLVNFGGLVPGKVVIPAPANNIKLNVPAAMGDSLSFLPFLGEAQVVHGVKRGDKLEFTLPPLERGAVVSFGTEK